MKEMKKIELNILKLLVQKGKNTKEEKHVIEVIKKKYPDYYKY